MDTTFGLWFTEEQREAKEQVTRDLARLEQRRNVMRVEAAHLAAYKKKLARQAEEVKIANKLASEKYAEGEQALEEARHVLALDRRRLRSTKQQTWRVYEQEKGLVQNSLGKLVKRKLTSTKVSGALSDRLEPSLSALTMDDSQAHLAFFKHMASQDHDFIKREDRFLMNLRKDQLRGQSTTA